MAEIDSVVVLTRKGVETMVKEGGCGYWRANAQSLAKCRYVVATRNSRPSDREGDEPHGSAFLVGEIDGLAPSPKGGRFLIRIKRFALLEKPKEGVWKPGGSNPVHYENLRERGIDVRRLDFLPWPTVAPPAIRPLTIAEAKGGLALAFGVAPDQIEINIKG